MAGKLRKDKIMENDKQLRRFKWFWVWQDAEREEWFRQMSLNGWHLSSIGALGLSYSFQKGEAIDFDYRLDFRSVNKQEVSNYLNFIQDAGWEHILTQNGWYYFRKIRSKEFDEDFFTDAESKVEKYKRLLITFPLFYPFVFIVFFKNLDKYPLWFAIILVSVVLLLTLFVSISIIGVSLRIKNLQA